METNFFSPLKRRITALALSMIMLVTSGCGLRFSDSGSDTMESIKTEDYLDLGVFDRPAEEIAERVYETYTLEYGTFTQEQSGGASVFEPITFVEKVKLTSGTMIFEKMLVEVMSYVKAGTAIAEVSMETDSISIKEATLAHERLLVQYENAKLDREEAIKDRSEVLDKLGTDEEKQLQKLQWQIQDLNWNKTEDSYKDRIKDSEDNINELKKNAATKTIKAEHSGYVYSIESINEGDYLKNGQSLLTLVPTNKVYLEMTDRDMNFNFGKEFIATIRIGRSYKEETSAYSVSPSLRSVYFDLNTGKAYFITDVEMVSNIPKANITVSGITSSVENVLLVPVDAVEKVSNSLFVTVLNEDGSLARLPFISGGSNRNYYWVMSGLEAGMKVIHD